jgi:hypothetical protein
MAASSRSKAIAGCLFGATVLTVVSCGEEIDFPHAPAPQVPPSTTAPAYAAFLRGQLDTLTFQAIDANGDAVQSVEADLSELPPGNDAIFSTAALAGTSGLRCRLLWTATDADTGLYRVTFIATDERTGPTDTTLLYTVDHAVDIDPVVSCPGTVYVTVGVPQAFSVTATDPDGDPLFELWPTEPLGSSLYQSLNLLSWTFASNGSTAAGTLQIRANVAGWFPVRFTAFNAAHGFATTMVVAH